MTSVELAYFSPLARQFALQMGRWSTEASVPLAWAAVLATHFRAEGHTHVPLARVAGRPVHEVIEGFPTPTRLPGLHEWIVALQRSGVVGEPGDRTPLLLAPLDRLYLHRYWEYEQEVVRALRLRAGRVIPRDLLQLAAQVRRHFPVAGGMAATVDWQALAAVTAVLRGLTLISGGPGTGKTRTVARHLSLLAELETGKMPRVSLAAPTGKAAARLSEALRTALADSVCGPESGSIAIEAVTVHRMLGFQPGSAEARFNSDRPLPADVVIVDEASMLDLALLARLLRALPDSARLVLVGDKDQLSSVEAGSVMGEIWNHPWRFCYSPEWAGLLGAVLDPSIPSSCLVPGVPPLADSMVELRKSHRFGEDSALEVFSRAVRSSDLAAARAVVLNPVSDVALSPRPSRHDLFGALADRFGDWHARLIEAGNPGASLAILRERRLLTPLRRGAWGVDALQRGLVAEMRRRGILSSSSIWYSGRPILIKSNAPDLQLSNGDVGIALKDTNDGRLWVWFEGADGQVRPVSPLRLPPHETAYATTVHKSQGSEFDEVLLLLPDHSHPLVNREMIYTAVTRARHRAEIWGTESELWAGLARTTERYSGLGAALWAS